MLTSDPIVDEGAGRIETQRLLVADDSPVERLALAHLLRHCGYEVDEAEDGQAALSLIRHRRIDLLLLDLNMPSSDGFDVLKYLQEHRPGLPVILLSGMEANRIQHSMQRLPSQELPPLLIKPVDPEMLLQIVAMRLTGDLPT